MTSFRGSLELTVGKVLPGASSCEGGRAPRCGVRDKKPAPWRPVPYARYPSSEFGTIPFVFSHGHFGFHKKSAASVCMILVISWEARRRAGAIKATQATNLMVFPAVSDHSRLLVRLAFIGRPRWGLRSRELVVRSLRHLPWGSRRQAMKFRRSAAGKSRCRTPLPSRGAELLPEWRAF